MTDCIDLKERFGDRWRIGRDESFSYQSTDPWRHLILCKYGEIYPYGGRLLCCLIVRQTKQGASRMADKVLREVPGSWLHQDGDVEKVIVFEVDYLEIVAGILRAKVRHRLSAAHKEKLIAAGSQFSSKASLNS